MKSIPVRTVGISFSSITWQRAFTTTVFILGYTLDITSSFEVSSNLTKSEYLIIFSNKYFVPLGLNNLFLKIKVQYIP